MLLRRRVPALVIAVALTAGLAACGDDDASTTDPGPPSTTSTTAPAGEDPTAPDEPPAPEHPEDPDGFSFLAARHCSNLANAIDRGIVLAAQQASIPLLEAATRGADLTADDLAVAADAYTARLEQLQGLRADMAALEVPPAQQERWDLVVGVVDPAIDQLAARLALVESGDPATVIEGVTPGGIDATLDDDSLAALEALDLDGRDCELVYMQPGIPAEHATFLTDAGTACTTVVSRRRAAGFDEHIARVVLEAVAAALSDEVVEPTDELRTALELSVAEWAQTAADLSEVRTDDVPDAAEWKAFVGRADAQHQLAAERLAALESGDAEAIAAAFVPAGERLGSGRDLAALGLDGRDCRSISG